MFAENERPSIDTIKEAVLYRRQFGRTGAIEAAIVQPQQYADPHQRPRSQFLALRLTDTRTGQRILIRLGTFRKILGWITKLGFTTARRLTDTEITILNRSL